MQQLLSNLQNFLSGGQQHLLYCERDFFFANLFPFVQSQFVAQMFQFLELPVQLVGKMVDVDADLLWKKNTVISLKWYG